jgi:nitrogen fixation protein NifQ
MGNVTAGYAELIDAARDPENVVTQAFAGLISLAPSRPVPYDVPIAALDKHALESIRIRYFPDLRCPLFSESPSAIPTSFDAFDDLVELLFEHRTFNDEENTWLVYVLATACMGANHLWQDMGLPNRAALSWLINHYFGSLATLNTGDMKWKKFFYRQLCQREGLILCKSPSCGSCTDFSLCFGPEDDSRRAG